ncbi:hypothetical protein NBRC116188_28020 [Oceaniserpentilla sp. 4NH20-0058]
MHDLIGYNCAKHLIGIKHVEGIEMAEQKNTMDFEQSLAQLEGLVEKLENSEFTLEQSLEAFEQGVKLTRQCQQALSQAEQKVQILMEESGQSSAVPFEGDAQ